MVIEITLGRHPLSRLKNENEKERSNKEAKYSF